MWYTNSSLASDRNSLTIAERGTPMRTIGLAVTLCVTTLASAAERPNIVFILADDYGWRDVSLEGSTFYETPNIDRIAREGMRFTPGLRRLPGVQSVARQHHDRQVSRLATGSPTGSARPRGRSWKTQHEAAAAALRTRTCRPRTSTLAEAFRDAGYRTFFAGKWHLGGEGS